MPSTSSSSVLNAGAKLGQRKGTDTTSHHHSIFGFSVYQGGRRGPFWNFLMFGQGWFRSQAIAPDRSGLVFWLQLETVDKITISVSPALVQTT